MKFPKQQKIRSKAIRNSARGESCSLRIPSVCNGNNETVVFAHLEGNKGTASKNHDIFGVYCCSGCHDWLDQRGNHGLYQRNTVSGLKDILRALQETQFKLVQKGIIEVKK